MNNSSTFQFRWLSPLGASVVFFLLYGAALCVALGLQWTILLHTRNRQPALLTPEHTDTVVFGQPPAIFYQNDPVLFTVDRAEEDWRDGMAFCFGIALIALAWFGLRRGLRWALWTLTLAGLGMIPYAGLFMEPVLRSGAPWTLLDPPPVLTFQVLIVPIAVMFGWIGLSPRYIEREESPLL
jgi:hypothetical protein